MNKNDFNTDLDHICEESGEYAFDRNAYLIVSDTGILSGFSSLEVLSDRVNERKEKPSSFIIVDMETYRYWEIETNKLKKIIATTLYPPETIKKPTVQKCLNALAEAIKDKRYN